MFLKWSIPYRTLSAFSVNRWLFRNPVVADSKYGGGYKSQEECDHVTCECGHEFCWDCGVDRRVPLAHDNRWHKPSCRYHTPYHEVAEPPRPSPHCPACRLLAASGDPRPCCWPPDDGYPETYIRM
ncbi:unnamed protein product [Symbiodinium natans]|uniref:RING-type domain-containing protein n=1 Tax=Symbiodinium natans TaxID=878477 RepID=A0A812Q0V6_9DINO|nr:unnamed protein product [Symbiodinium natans]